MHGKTPVMGSPLALSSLPHMSLLQTGGTKEDLFSSTHWSMLMISRPAIASTSTHCSSRDLGRARSLGYSNEYRC